MKEMFTLICFNEVVECFIEKRTSRFSVDVVINGEKKRAYLCNTGKLPQLLIKGKRAYCLKTVKNIRLLSIEDYDLGALVDTYYQMKSFEKALELNAIPWLKKCIISKRNPKLGNSVIDYLLTCNGDKVYTELKSAILRLNSDIASYPDTISLRGRRHLNELVRHVAFGGKAMVIFIAALPYVNSFKPNDKVDPLMAILIREAIARGVIVKAFSEYFEPKSKCIILDNYDLKLII